MSAPLTRRDAIGYPLSRTALLRICCTVVGAIKLARNNIAGSLIGLSAYFMKSPRV